MAARCYWPRRLHGRLEFCVCVYVLHWQFKMRQSSENAASSNSVSKALQKSNRLRSLYGATFNALWFGDFSER